MGFDGEEVVAINGDLITINQNIMEVGKLYKFVFKNHNYGVYKRRTGEVVILDES
jgi:hypothetical protein